MTDFARLEGKTVLVTGADGMLGRAFSEILKSLGDQIHVLSYARHVLDVTDAEAVMDCARQRPDLIVHCAGMSLADRCEEQPDLARAVHVGGTRNIGRLALETGARVFYPQSVFIFDGAELPVTEETRPAPGLVYGQVKLEAERYLLAEVPGSLVVRMAGFFGGEERDKNFVGQFTRQLGTLLASGQRSCEVGDRIWQPTYTVDLARNSLLLLALGRTGIYHMGALGEATFWEVAQACIVTLGLASRIAVVPCPADVFNDAEPARRPRRMVTDNLRLQREGLNRQRPWREALREYLSRPYFDSLRSGTAASLEAPGE